MTIRWNANFVRGLAQSVLERAKVIRTGLLASAGAAPQVEAAAPKPKKPRAKVPATKKTATRKKVTKRSRKTHA